MHAVRAFLFFLAVFLLFVSPTAPQDTYSDTVIVSFPSKHERFTEAELIRQVEEEYDLVYIGPAGDLELTHLFAHTNPGAKRKLRREVEISIDRNLEVTIHNQRELRRSKRGGRCGGLFSDPMFPYQWNLCNAAAPNNDVNVTGVWRGGVFGGGVNVAMVDDGIDFTHDDLKSSYLREGSYDFNFMKADPYPSLADDVHGTRCAGQIVAMGNNGKCGVGVAPGARISGIRILSRPTTDATEASALSYRRDLNHVYSNSWGPYDDGQTFERPGRFCSAALSEGVEKGRGGLGSVFVFASGNGGVNDNCNFDGYASSRYVMAVGAVDANNNTPFYQEPCASQISVTYSSNTVSYIATTDVRNNCYSRHSGTSAAAPVAAGIVALLLSVRPDLTWRDVQHVFVAAAAKNTLGSGIHLSEAGWDVNGAGLPFHHMKGFGIIDAYTVVETGRSWVPRPREEILKVPSSLVLDAKKAQTGYIDVWESSLQRANAPGEPWGTFFIERVLLTTTIECPNRGGLVIDLASPLGMVSHLATRRPADHSSETVNSWNFTSVAYWGGSPFGRWSVTCQYTSTTTGSCSCGVSQLLFTGYSRNAELST